MFKRLSPLKIAKLLHGIDPKAKLLQGMASKGKFMGTPAMMLQL